MAKTKSTILEGSIFPALIKFTIPLALAVLLQALYGAVDLIVVGKFGTTESVSAVANGSQIMRAITDVVIGLSMGVTVIVGHAIGAKEDERAARAVGAMVKLFTVLALLMSLAVVILAPKMVEIMRVPTLAIPKTIEYIKVCGVGMLFIIAYNAISSLFRGMGDSKSPLIFIAVAAASNVVLDLLLCGVFKMDVLGAAIATVAAQAISVLFSLIKMLKKGLPFEMRKKHFKKNGKTIWEIIKIGAPIALQQFLVSVSFLIIMAIVNNIGLIESASVGIAEKLFVFLAIIPISFMSSMSAFTAQNIGAKKEYRAIIALKQAILVSLTYGLIMTCLTMFKGELLARFFEDDPMVVAQTAIYLKGVSMEYISIAAMFCLLGYFNGKGKTGFVLAEGLFTSFLVRIPLSFYFSTLAENTLFMIALAVPISSFVGLFLSVSYYFVIKKKSQNIRKLNAEE